MVYNVLVFAEKETTELQFKTHAELQIKRLKKKIAHGKLIGQIKTQNNENP